MNRVLNTTRKRAIGAVIAITAFIVIIIGLWLQFRIVPDAEGFLPPTPTSPPTAGEILVFAPHAGDTVYAELIYMTGEIQNAPQTLIAQIYDVDNNLLATAPIPIQFGKWTIEMLRPIYIGEATIQIVSAVNSTAIHATIPIFLGDIKNRPSGTFGSLITPSDGDQAGGDTILVQGRASGVVDNKIQLVLENGDGVTILHEVIILNPYGVDDVLWQTDLPIAGVSGSATLTVYFTHPDVPDPILSRVTLVITQVAG